MLTSRTQHSRACPSAARSGGKLKAPLPAYARQSRLNAGANTRGSTITVRSLAPTTTVRSSSLCPSKLGPIKFDRIKGVLFDIDGTLTNSDTVHFKVFQDILAERGFNGGAPIDESFFRVRIAGRHNPQITADLFPHLSQEEADAFSDDKEERFRQMAASLLQPLPGLPAFAAWVEARGLRRAAVTNAPRANTEMMLGALKLDKYFEAVILGEECSRPKPHPDPYQAGLRALGLLPHEAVVMEDSPTGVQAAVAAGIPVIGLATGQTPEALLRAGAQCTVANYEELLPLLPH